MSDVRLIGEALQRPECVLANRRGTLYVSDRQGYATIASDGRVTRVIARNPPEHFLSNGIALLRDGSVLIANLGLDRGVWRLAPDGEMTPLLLEVDGIRLHPTNFVDLD